MTKIIGQITTEVQETILGHLNEHIAPHLYADVSNYAKGRMRCWLPYEAPLSKTGLWKYGQFGEHADKVWDYIQRVVPADFKPDTALLSKGGAIQRHRDATYADYRAIGINLGEVTWCYETCYPEYRWSKDAPASAPVQKIAMTGGEIFEFNCKNPHWVEDVSPERWGINVWHVNPKVREDFENFVTEGLGMDGVYRDERNARIERERKNRNAKNRKANYNYIKGAGRMYGM